MKLWLLSRTDMVGYDEFDSAVVAAIDEESARRTPPDAGAWAGGCWAEPKAVKVVYIGRAAKGTKAGPILGSFNAG